MNSSETWLAEALRPVAMEVRIGSTRPIEMKPTTQANVVAQTALGWAKKLAVDDGAAEAVSASRWAGEDIWADPE
ncbi:hypothetical protein [Breoghania sp.]|uniref:hypothetical protein n=1 Tax=Breoghania sp. TaxID=2065378 RepID=UPI00262845AD|nr:hypothetical protein [Breoghania sp.]MDJ0931110.1 hypothetical protein [Breoghania sp.]